MMSYFVQLTTCIYFFGVHFARGGPISGIASNVKSELILVNKLHSSISNGINDHNSMDPNSVPIGESLDLFYRYGFFSLSVRVVPRDDAGSWIVREPTLSVFEHNSLTKQNRRELGHFETDFQVFFCDDEEELFEAYFRDFSAEGIEQPHKLFTGSWHSSTKARYFGMSKDAFDGESSFVLVKIPKKRFTLEVSAGGTLRSGPAEAIRTIQPGNKDAVLAFLKDYGSHYIQSITVGDVVYQVFALTPDQYSAARRAAFASGGRHQLSPSDFSRFHSDYLAPWTVRETGTVQIASGDEKSVAFVESMLQDQGQFGSYPNIFRLQEDPRLMEELEVLTSDTEAVVGMRFSELTPWVPDIQTREYFKGIMETQSTLWDANL